ncbi:pre-peptidase C-terminal domain-containing protein [Oscillatoria sp. CS-180]|uniref:Ig-like domain-containing protein n=1 Tax=Oscillatoria sp. CS-180 TaxID=3021720 RepID=UPI00232D8AAA|nr:Ig-like domain-containing protein [Oscillatoria sp. CS-180]MDB9527174.1 pre-peptidase C-terminal domain-containing protein [Oscillatoria sp. CS-180]
MVQVSLTTSTNFDGDFNALVEDQGTALTVRFDLDEPAPPGGLKVYIDSDIVQIINRLDLPAAIQNPQFENLNVFATQTNFDNSGLAVEIIEGATFGTVTLNVFDNDEPDTFLPETFDGLVEAVFSLRTADQVAPEDQAAITGVGDYTIDPDAASSTVLFVDDVSQLPTSASGYDEAVGGDISNDPSNPLTLPLTEGTTRLTASTGDSDQEYVTVTVPEGFELSSLVLEAYSPNDVGFIGVQQGSTFTEPLDDSAIRENILGYTLFGNSRQIGTDILDEIGNGLNAQGFDGPLPSGTYTFALQQLGAESDYTLAFNVTEARVVENTAPVASNDTYTRPAAGSLEVTAASGVLSNDTDGDGDTLTAAIATEPANGTVTLNSDGSFIYTADDTDPIADSFTYTVSDGEGGTDEGTVTVNASTGGLPIVSFEAIPATVSEEGSAEDRLLQLVFTVVGEIPDDGLVVNFDNLFGITDQLDANDDRAAFNNLGFAGFDVPNNRIFVRLDANESSIDLPILNDLIEETTTFDFQLAEGDGYTVDPDKNATLFTINDDNGGPGVGPTISLSVSETNLTEGDSFTVNFTVDGDMPDGGLDVLVQSSASAALGEFALTDLDALDLSGVTNLRPGDTTGQSFIATLTEPNASITLEVFDDIVAQEPVEIPFTLANGELYEVDPNAASVTLTIADEAQPVGPTVGLSVDTTTLIEGGDPVTLTISVDGEVPAEGLEVLINDAASTQSGARSLTEFDVANVTTTGIDGFPTPADGDSGFVVKVTDSTATITLAAFDEGADENEADEVFTFEVVDGEAYEVDANASEVTVNILDAGDTGLSVSLDLLAGTFGEEGELVTPNLVLSDSGTPVLSLLLSADGPVPEDGLVVNVETDLLDITEFIQGSNFVPTAFGGQVVGAIYGEDGSPMGLQVRLDNRNTVVNFNTGFANPTDGELPIDVSFALAVGEGYTPVETPATIVLYQDASQLPTPTDPPEVSIGFTSDTGVLTEGGDTGTLNFTVDGEIPPEGLVVFVSNNQFAGIVDFDLLNATTTGGSFPAPDGTAGGFFFKMTESSASITFQAREDETVEGLEAVNVELQPLPGYTIADDAGDVSVLVQETDASKIQVSLETSPEVLVEAEGTVSVHTFNLSSPPPAEGVTVRVQTPGLDDFDPSGITTTGISGDIQVLESSPEQLEFTITEQTATISLPVADDGLAEAAETVVFTLVEPSDDADYQVDPETNSGSFTIVDTADQVPAPGIEDTGNTDAIGDTIDSATDTGLTANSNSVTVEGRLNGNFFTSDLSLRTDNTEDVDMYSVDLGAGDVLRLDIDARNTRSNDESPDTILRLFDAEGNQLAQSDDDFAPDELFAPGRQDSYLEFTAETAGTYFVGVSSFGNGEFGFTNAPYDPNITGSGTGRSSGAYTLNLTLNEAFVAEATEIPDSTGDGPTVSLSATAATYDTDDNLIANALVQFVENGSASILTLGLNVEGMIPEEGIEVFLTSDADFANVFSTRAPFSPGGAEVLGAVYDETGAPIGLRVNLLSNTAILNLNLTSPEEAPTDGVETITFTLEPAAGYVVGDSTFSAPIYDVLTDVPALPTVPTVGIAVSETELIESEGSLTTLTFTLDTPPPAEGVVVNVDSGERSALGEFDVFNAEITGGEFPAPNFQASGFFFKITEQTATITLSAFDETTNPEIPAEDALEGIEEFTFAVQPGVGYAIAPEAGEITVTIADNPDSVVLPPDDGSGGEPPTIPTEEELNDTIADAIATGLSVDNPTYLVAGEIGTTRQTRNLIDRSEDVDMYAFDLEAGQTVILDVDAGGTGNAGVEGSLMDNVLRVFDASGNEVAINENGAAPDEVFQANGDAYLEFEAPETGTYYVGISNLGNNFYDPNTQGSGSGWIFDGSFEPGEYRFEATLVETTPAPVVGMTVNAIEISEEDPDPVVTLTFTVESEIPDGGLPILFDGSDVVPIFDEIVGDPVIDGFALGDFFDPNQSSLFEFVLLENTSTVTLNILDDVIEETPEDYTFSILSDEGGLLESSYQVDPGAASVTVSLVDGNGGPGVGPTVGISLSTTELEEGGSLTVNFTVEGEIPTEGLEVVVDSPTPFALGEFVIFDENNNPAVELNGIAGFPEVYDGQGSSFLVTLTDPNASLTLDVFDDGANEGLETLTFDVLNGELYEVAADTGSVTLTINDFEVVGTDEGETLVGDDADNSIAGLAGDDNIAGGLGNDIILGDAGDDILRGDLNLRSPQDFAIGGNDIIFGGEGNDRIGGKAGNDILSGDAGDDEIWGDAGNDILMGVTGNDILTGDNGSSGSGSDLFVFGNGDGTDTITDFEVGVDSIGLVEGELVFADLTLTQDGANTLLGVSSSGETLAVLNNVQASALDENSFQIVPDVSNPDEALALV